MTLTLDVLLYKISQQFQLKINGTIHANRRIDRAIMWDGQHKTANAIYLYIPGISPSNNIDHLNSDDYLTLLDTHAFQQVSKPGCYICCEESQRWAVINGIIYIVSEFYQWVDKISEVKFTGDNFPDILTEIGHYIQVDLSLINRDLFKIAVYNAYRDTERDDLFGEIGELDINTIQKLSQDYPDYETDYTKDGIIRHPANTDQDPQCLYFYNIQFQGELHLRMMINIKYQQNHSATHRLLSWVGEQLADKYVDFYQAQLYDQYQKPLYEGLRALLLGNDYDQEQLKEHLGIIGWSPTHSYKVLHLKPIDPLVAEYQLNYYAAQFEHAFVNCKAVPLNSDLYALVNITRFPKEELAKDKYAIFLRESLFFSGSSVAFHDIQNTYIHRKQADRALYYGMHHDSSIWHHEFESISLKYILEKCTEEYDAIELSHPAVNILREYDTAHPGADLIETLRAYLHHQFNATQTAAVLNVHRTTFLYRLRRIEELTKLHLDNPDTILHLMISFAI